MKKIISKKNMHAVRRAVCALLIIAMLSPALSVGAEAVDTAAAETSKATAVSVETPNQGTAAVEDSGTDIGSGTSASEESGTTPKGDTDTTEEDTDASEEDTTDAKKDSTVSDNEVTESEEGSTISDNEVTESEEDSSVSDNEVTVSENEAALSGNDVSSALIDNKAGEGVLAEPKATLYVKQGKVESMNDLPGSG